MSEKDQHAAIGSLVARATATKQKRAALMAEAQLMGTIMGDVADKLKSLDFVEAFWDGRQRGHVWKRPDVTLREYKPHDAATRLLDDLRQVSAELRELRKLMKDAGVDID